MQTYSASRNGVKAALLEEVSFVRPLLIVLIVLLHAFTVYNGRWPAFKGFCSNEGYAWVSRFVAGFVLEAFTFVSGYVWAFQRLSLGRPNNFRSLMQKKIKRLLVPSVVFSLLYYQLFGKGDLLALTSVSDGAKAIVDVLSGVGHLWYLPMLLLCFAVFSLIEKFTLSRKWVYLVLVLVSLLPLPDLPFQLVKVPYYLLFFCAGFDMWQYRENVSARTDGVKVVGLWLLYVVLLALLTYVAGGCKVQSGQNFVIRNLIRCCPKICQMVYAFCGVWAMYKLSLLYVSHHRIADSWKELGTLCFSVYIYQEFILWYLYYYTSLPTLAGSVWLPWIGFAIALPFSLLLGKVTKML